MKPGVIIALLLAAFCVLGAISCFDNQDTAWGWGNSIAALLMATIALYEWRRS